MTAFICRDCTVSGESNFYKSQKYYCKICWNKRTAQAGKDNVKQLKTEYGGKCVRCGYDKCFDALEFHHTDPDTKEFSLGQARGYNYEKLKAEMDKCILVCRNCHAELHHEMRNSQK